MNRLIKSAFALFLTLLLLFHCAAVYADGGFEEKYSSTAAHLQTCPTPEVGSIGGEWLVIGLARSGRISREMKEGYFRNVLHFVEDKGSAKLDRSKSTENSRVILALTAIGKDVTDVAGHNLLEPLADFKFVVKQGLNGAVWALIALDSLQYDIPETTAQEPTTREKLIAYLLDRQNESGGWDIKDSYADPDMTGMVIQSLAPYYSRNQEVKEAVDRALTTLSETQLESGAFVTYGSQPPESAAQMLTALCALGIEPREDSRFIKNGSSILDNLLSFSVENGFEHFKNDGYNQMSTEQAYYAMTALYRLENGEAALYDMCDTLPVYDVNLDGKANISDVTLVQQYVAELCDFNARQLKVAHAYPDGNINISYATEIQRYISSQ